MTPGPSCGGFGPPDLPPGPRWLAGWFVFCALLALGILGVGAWAVITLVNWVVSR